MLSVKKDFDFSDSVYAYFQVDYSYVGEMFLDGSNDPFSKQSSYNLMNARLFMNFA